MKSFLKLVLAASLVGLVSAPRLSAQTDGEARLQVTLLDYTGTGNTRHWTVVWVTTASGTFIKTLRKQGPSITSSQWGSHCSTWNNAKAGSTALDGYSSATAANYTGTNSPVILTWNGRGANNALMPDGDYKFWVQYAEDSGQGPFTTSGLLWTKGPSSLGKTFPNQGVNFANMRVDWAPAISAPPNIASVRIEGGSLIITGSGTANRQFILLSSPDLNQPVEQWTPMATNVFGANGSFTIGGGAQDASNQRYYRLRSL